MRKLFKTKPILCGVLAVLIFATLAYAATVSVRPGGIAFPYWYSYTSGVKSTYYLTHPTLTANEEVVSLTASQTMTNKTLTSPTVTSPIINSRLNTAGYIISSSGSAVPTATTAGYAPGSIFVLDNSTLGKAPMWMNQGTAASCAFYPFGPVMGYGFKWATGPVDCVNGEVATEYYCSGQVRPLDICFAGYAVSNDNDQIIGVEAVSSSVPGEENGVLITANNDPLTAHDYHIAGLRDKCVPEYDIFAAGEYDAVADDDATIAITVAGVLASDIAFAYFSDTNDTDTIASVVCTAGVVTITESTDPGTDHSYFYVVLRPRGSFAPSHYVAYAGQFTTVGGDATEVATVTGVAATDIIISVIEDHASGGVSILKIVPTANTITWTFDQDPTATHLLSYAVLRAY